MILVIVDPWAALRFFALVIGLQQFDGNILGPKILGDSPDEFLKAVCQMGDLIIIFLIHMDYRRLSLGTASPVVRQISTA